MKQEIYRKQFSINEIWSESWKRFEESFELILVITLIAYAPINILTVLVPAENPLDSFNLYSLIIWILERCIDMISIMSIAYAIKNKIDGKSISIEEALKKSLSRLGAAIETMIFSGIFLSIVSLLIIPGIIYSVYWIFTIYVIIFKNESADDALAYSKALVQGRWWTVAGYSFFFGLLGLTIEVIGDVSVQILPENLLVYFGIDIFIDILMSFFIVVGTIFFINFDTTKLEENNERINGTLAT